MRNFGQIFAFSNFRIFPSKSAIRPDFRIFAFLNFSIEKCENAKIRANFRIFAFSHFSMEKGKMRNWENEKIRPNFSHLPILFGFVIKIYDLFSCTFINLYSVFTVIILKTSFFALIMNANCEVPPYTFINLWTVSLVIILQKYFFPNDSECHLRTSTIEHESSLWSIYHYIKQIKPSENRGYKCVKKCHRRTSNNVEISSTKFFNLLRNIQQKMIMLSFFRYITHILPQPPTPKIIFCYT